MSNLTEYTFSAEDYYGAEHDYRVAADGTNGSWAVYDPDGRRIGDGFRDDLDACDLAAEHVHDYTEARLSGRSERVAS